MDHGTVCDSAARVIAKDSGDHDGTQCGSFREPIEGAQVHAGFAIRDGRDRSGRLGLAAKRGVAAKRRGCGWIRCPEFTGQ